MGPLQAVTGTSLLAAAGTFLLAAAFYAATLHVAARWVVGVTPLRRALLVGPFPAAVVLALWLADLPGAAILAVAAVVDLGAIAAVYDLDRGRTVLLTAAHVVVTAALFVALLNLWRSATG